MEGLELRRFSESLILPLVRRARSPALGTVAVISGLVAVALIPGYGAPARSASEFAPTLFGRQVKELVVTAEIRFGASLPPGLPTVPIYTMRPNRFVPVREDSTAVYFQADGAAFAEGSARPGGLCVSKASADEIYGYRGDGRYPKMYLPFVGRVQPADLRKVQFRFITQRKHQ